MTKSTKNLVVLCSIYPAKIAGHIELSYN